MAIWQYTYVICHIIWAQRPKLKRSIGELIFYSKIKSFQYFQCLAASVSVLSHMESLGNIKNKYKTKKEKVRNHTIHNKVQQKKKKKRGRQTEKKKKKKKKEKEEEEEEEEEEAVASWCHPCFVVVFFLFSFLFF